MLNSITLMGRLVADPELRSTTSGVQVCSFRIAVDREFQKQGEEKQADFIDIVAWRGTAEFVSRYFSKGRLILVQGSLQSRKYQDKDGNNRTAFEVQADKVFFTGEKKDSGDSSGTTTNRYDSYTPPPAREQPSAYSSGSESDFTPLPDEDLPF